MRFCIKYQLIFILITFFDLNSSSDNQCPIACSVFCECFKYANGTSVCGNCRQEEFDLADRDSDFHPPHHSTGIPLKESLEKPYKLTPDTEQIIRFYPYQVPKSSWRIEASSDDSSLSVRVHVNGSNLQENCLRDIIQIFDVKSLKSLEFCPWNLSNYHYLGGPLIRISLHCHAEHYQRDSSLSMTIVETNNKKTSFKTVDKLLIVMACVCIFLFIVFLTVAILVIIKFRQNRLARQRCERDNTNNPSTTTNSTEQSESPSISVISPPSYETICSQPPSFLDYIPEEKPLPGTAPPAYASFRSNQQRTRQPKEVNNTQASTDA